MGDVPALGAFCFKDSILIDKMRTTAARQTKRIAELEAEVKRLNGLSAAQCWEDNQRLEAENNRLKEEYGLLTTAFMDSEAARLEEKIKNKRLTDAFIKYAEHDALCDYLDTGECECGCASVLKEGE